MARGTRSGASSGAGASDLGPRLSVGLDRAEGAGAELSG